MMREQGYFAERRAELGQLNARIFRAARIVVDTGLHIGDLGVDEAVAYMETNAGLPEPVARAEVSRYCAWPTQAPSYLTGSLEIERIRAALPRRGTRQPSLLPRRHRRHGLPAARPRRARRFWRRS